MRPIATRSVRPLAIATIGALACYAGACASDLQSDTTCPQWDLDCDGLSNAVERDPENASLYHFDLTTPDVNPSAAHGVPNNGYLSGSLDLPDIEGGFYTYRPDADPVFDQPDSNDWGTLALINMIEATARGWVDHDPRTADCYAASSQNDSAPPSLRFGVGDMSKFSGGAWYHSYDTELRHHDHQNGLDVDVRYLRLDHQNTPLDLQVDSANGFPNYDFWGTLDLVNCFIATGSVQRIYADSSLVGFWNAQGSDILVNDPSHYNHFHVTVIYP